MKKKKKKRKKKEKKRKEKRDRKKEGTHKSKHVIDLKDNSVKQRFGIIFIAKLS